MKPVQPSTPAAGFTTRFECKYLLDPWTAESVRDFVAMVLDLDPYCRDEPDGGYLNTSLYLDSPDLICYRSTAVAARNRFKLRARWYRGDPDCGPLIEEKRRADNSITKLRANLLPGSMEQLCRGEEPEIRMAERGSVGPMEDLIALAAQHTARPSCFVRYRREAWIADSGYLRVSFDRALEAHALCGGAPAVDSPGWRAVALDGIILELKFEQSAPQWMGELVQRFNLRRRSIPKYLLCVDALAQGRDFQHAGAPGRWGSPWTA